MPYLKVYLPEHKRADVAGWVSKHILIMEEHLERKLEDGEVIHHADFNKLNNEITNLILTSRKDHQRIPAMQAKFLVEHNLMEKFWQWYDENKERLDMLLDLEARLSKLTSDQEKQKQKQKLSSGEN